MGKLTRYTTFDKLKSGDTSTVRTSTKPLVNTSGLEDLINKIKEISLSKKKRKETPLYGR